MTLLLSVAIFPIINQSVSPSTILASCAGFLLITAPNRTWLVVSKDFHATVSLLLTVWNADTGALVAGRVGTLAQTNLPRPLWLQTISPAKSVEGLIGGLLGGSLTYWSLPWFWSMIHYYKLAPNQETVSIVDSLSSNQRFCIGILLSIAAVLGDLWESSLKRAFQVKDSGKLLPGHGGVLDRFDSSLLAVVLYQYLGQTVP